MPPNASLQRRERTTIEDVAFAAGVSVATVSRALRGLPNVAEPTRERIEKIASELDYRADPAASRLAAGRSRSVAVAVPLLDGWYFAHVLAGAEAVFAEAGYDTIIVSVGAQGQGRHVLEAAGPIHRRVDGLICVDLSLTDEELRRMRSERMEVVYVGRDNANIPCLGIDDVEVGRLATTHLIDLGHRRIGIINGDAHDHEDDVVGFVVPHNRQMGYELAHRDAGLPVDLALFVPGYFTIEGGYEAMIRLLDLPEPPTAVFSFSDEMAFGALWAARERGIDVPGDLSLVGVDDHDVSKLLDLTTVHQDVDEHGARAARTMIDLLAGVEIARERQNSPIRLIERGTTSPPRT